MNYFKKFFIFFSLIFFFFSCKKDEQPKLTIATAANMQFAMKEIIQTFEKETEIACEMVISSSGKLTALIKEGAPYDIFVSANMKYPNELYKSGFTLKQPEIYAYGKLVMWTMRKDIKLSFEILEDKHIKNIALANPKTAPYGFSAKEVLINKDIYHKIENKLVFGESVSQTNQFIASGVAEIGFTAKSVVMAPKIKDDNNWIDIDPDLYSPIAQGIVILINRRELLHKAKKFNEFLISSKGKEILNNFGYSVND